MTLKLVTYEGDLTQFLVEAKTGEEAIKKAIKANEKLDVPIDDEALEVINDSSVYSYEDVDWFLLTEILKRDDMNGKFEDAVVFGF